MLGARTHCCPHVRVRHLTFRWLDRLTASDEDHQSPPDDYRRFGDAGPCRVPSIFVGAAPNADDSDHDVGKRKEVETDDYSSGQAGEDRSDGSRLRQNVGEGAIGDSVVPKGLAEWNIATPKRI